MMPDTAEDTDYETSDSELTLAEVIEFGRGRVAQEVEAQEGDMPNHADRLLVARAVDVMRAIGNIQMLREREDRDDPEDDYVKDTIEEAVVDVFLAIGSLDYEYDLRLADAFERRKEFIEDFDAYEEAMEGVESEQEAMEIFEDFMGDHVEQMEQAGVQVGDNVDKDDYDPDHRDRHIQ